MKRMAWLCLVLACSQSVQRTLTLPIHAASLDHDSPYLKVHMKDGGVYVLEQWGVNGAQGIVYGAGWREDMNRARVGEGRFEVQLADVALFETNVVENTDEVTALAVITGLSVGVSVFCLLNTKACFGSCPTFHLDGALAAEGFSDSVAPALEATDRDALGPQAGPRKLSLRMTNEAYETHVVKHVALLAAPRPARGRAFFDGDKVWRATRVAPPTSCTAAEGDCLAAARERDGRERVVGADEHDLAARETIELTFAPQRGPLGVVVASRQSLLSTYLFYQGLAWLGRDAGRRLAALDRADDDLGRRASALRDLLGRIEVSVKRGDEWVTAGEAGETGPLAVDTHLVRLPEVGADEPVRVRLRLTQGLWRLDAVALASLDGAVEPVRLEPRVVPLRLGRYGGAREPAAQFPIVALPGDEYALEFDLPDGPVELFLDSRGYYLEWMRQEWLAEESPARAALLFYVPRVALRLLAPAFKAREPELEAAFWRSRYAE